MEVWAGVEGAKHVVGVSLRGHARYRVQNVVVEAPCRFLSSDRIAEDISQDIERRSTPTSRNGSQVGVVSSTVDRLQRSAVGLTHDSGVDHDGAHQIEDHELDRGIGDSVAHWSGGSAGFAKNRVCSCQRSVGEAKDSTGGTRSFAIDKIAHHLQSDIGDGLRADGES